MSWTYPLLRLYDVWKKRSGQIPKRQTITIELPPKRPSKPLFSDWGLFRQGDITVCVASLRPVKRVHEAIHYVARIRRQRLLIFGEGPERDRLQSLIDQIGATNRIVLMGQASQEVLALAYNIADTIISTSEYEGYGMALREAKACGCTVISYVGDGRDAAEVDISLGLAPRLRKGCRQ